MAEQIGERKIIQISVTNKMFKSELNQQVCFALCDDGTLWSLHTNGNNLNPWFKHRSLPTEQEYQEQSKPDYLRGAGLNVEVS